MYGLIVIVNLYVCMSTYDEVKFGECIGRRYKVWQITYHLPNFSQTSLLYMVLLLLRMFIVVICVTIHATRCI